MLNSQEAEAQTMLKTSGQAIKSRLEKRVADSVWMKKSDDAKAKEVREIINDERAKVRSVIRAGIVERLKKPTIH